LAGDSHVPGRLADYRIYLAALYYLKSTCEDAERRSKPFSAIFWWSIKPEPAGGH
jgi:hypothetical protein